MGGPWPWKRAERAQLEGRARRAEQAKKQRAIGVSAEP